MLPPGVGHHVQPADRPSQRARPRIVVVVATADLPVDTEPRHVVAPELGLGEDWVAATQRQQLGHEAPPGR
ncbi:MAG: hypothetical protein H0W46_12100 [Acidimicrobiia bacterium]|nr:hypothetical protein [Acidimicrobiia bacterium]